MIGVAAWSVRPRGYALGALGHCVVALLALLWRLCALRLCGAHGAVWHLCDAWRLLPLCGASGAACRAGGQAHVGTTPHAAGTALSRTAARQRRPSRCMSGMGAFSASGNGAATTPWSLPLRPSPQHRPRVCRDRARSPWGRWRVRARGPRRSFVPDPAHRHDHRSASSAWHSAQP